MNILIYIRNALFKFQIKIKHNIIEDEVNKQETSFLSNMLKTEDGQKKKDDS